MGPALPGSRCYAQLITLFYVKQFRVKTIASPSTLPRIPYWAPRSTPALGKCPLNMKALLLALSPRTVHVPPEYPPIPKLPLSLNTPPHEPIPLTVCLARVSYGTPSSCLGTPGRCYAVRSSGWCRVRRVAGLPRAMLSRLL